MRKTNSIKKLRPTFAGMLGQINKKFSFFCFCLLNQPHQLKMKWRGMNFPAFPDKANSFVFYINSYHRHSSFRKPASLQHGYFPAFLHPFRCLFQGILNNKMFIFINPWFLFHISSFKAKSKTWICSQISSSHCLLKNYAKNFDLSQSGIPIAGFGQNLVITRPPMNIIHAFLIRYIGWSEAFNNCQINLNRRPCQKVTFQGFFRTAILSLQKRWNPVIPCAFTIIIFSWLFGGFASNQLLNFSKRPKRVFSNIGRLTAPSTIWFQNSNVKIRRIASRIIGCHKLNVA